jgi:hypothetical protein
MGLGFFVSDDGLNPLSAGWRHNRSHKNPFN